MKKGLTISLVLCGLLMFTGCGEEQNTPKTTKYEETMKEYAVSYYNAHLKGTEGLTSTKITIAQLKDAIAKIGDNYDMSKLADCKDESYVELIINQTNNNVDSVNYNMQCGN